MFARQTGQRLRQEEHFEQSELCLHVPSGVWIPAYRIRPVSDHRCLRHSAADTVS
ncbi:hypothetical protein PPL_07838 [Heterostelium album PN500]|uniref:Uncharacterized protein n=1 Tax=Heterostelium pallidum (strain ATCC 26659 / Pp 5 / PN500) TaxID=670386 RepID=D3BH36_HETP5|nr:hypothetical protein PPL_07838 [Heterostelium album PN500]EFA79420.1 hypothetical protein PPL_07838 [Heterostelium album PN500]|eukprot:XP_020431541.1 hypothetical protein PPL_07838 [Heterostelium album PN500]